MIDLQVRIHDKFSIEIKAGFIAEELPLMDHKDKQEQEFVLNAWIFVPNSLDINPQSYDSKRFYRDLKSNVRLITPVFKMREISSRESVPFHKLTKAVFMVLEGGESSAERAEFEYHVKMFSAIFKSSVRNETSRILKKKNGADKTKAILKLISEMESISARYRSIGRELNRSASEKIRNIHSFGDEFISSVIQLNLYKLLGAGPEEKVANSITKAIKNELRHCRKAGYPTAKSESSDNNRAVIFRQGILKKYIESDLFLRSDKRKDGIVVEQIYLSLAAGVAMVFATAVAFSFQRRYGNLTVPLFIALIVSYMLKDRIKELMRYFFAYRLKDKYYDNRITIGLKEAPIGTVREGMDFITDEKVPPEVMELRSRSPLLQAETRFNDEKIILYRKNIRYSIARLEGSEDYDVTGINDIMRLHLNTFVQKMDNPKVPLNILEQGQAATILGDKIYYLNLIIQTRSAGESAYRRFRIVMNRSGILDIEKMK